MASRGVVGSPAVAVVQWGDFDEVDPDGSTCTSAVTNAAGTALAGSPFTATRLGIGTYSVTISPTLVTAPDRLTFAWSATISAVATTQTTYFDVAGGYYFSLYALKLADPSLAGYSQLALDTARFRAETDAERIMGRAFVTRVSTETIVATRANRVALSWYGVNSVRALTVEGTAADTASLEVDRNTVTGVWSAGDTVVVTYVHGASAPPRDVVEAVMTLAKVRAQASNSAIPDRAGRYVADSGRTFLLDQAGAGKTGIPEVDAVLHRYTIPGIA